MNPNGSARDRVVMLVKNSFVFDARVRKEALSLRAAGWDVAVIALHVPGATPQYEETLEGIPVWRVPQLYANRPKWLGSATATPVMGPSYPPIRAPLKRGEWRRRFVNAIRAILPLVAPPLRRLNGWVVDTRMVRAAVGLEPAIVHAHDLNTLRAGLRIAQKRGARLVYDAHEFHRARNGMSPRAARVAGRLEDRLAPRADLVITATDTWADRLQTLWAGMERPLVIRNAPPSAGPHAPVDVRSRLSIPHSATVSMYVGSVQRGRGIEEAVKALSLLPSAHLVVIGYGADLHRLQDMSESLGLSGRAHFVGPVDNREIGRWLASADVGLCLIQDTSYSYFTSLPNKLLDYIQARIPVVASDFPEMGRVVKEYRVGEVCSPSDPQAVADAIGRVVRNRGYYAADLDRAARSLVWETEEQELVRAYRELAVAGSQQGVALQ